MTKNNKKIINIELFNIDSTTNSSLTYFFNSNLCPHAEISQDRVSTQLYVLDAQRFSQSLEKIIQTIKTPQQYAIVLYLKNKPEIRKDKSIFFLEKPINIEQLKEILDEVYNQLFNHQKKATIKEKPKIKIKDKTTNATHTHIFDAISENNSEDLHQQFKAQKYVGSNKDIKPGAHENKHIFIHKEKYLYYHLNNLAKRAAKEKHNFVLTLSSNKIFYDVKNKIFLHNISTIQCQYLHKTPLTENSINIHQVENLPHNIAKKIEKDRFIWESCLQSSRGRLPHETCIITPVVLKKWPNYSKLALFRHVIQISALWSRKPMSLYETARHLAIPQRYVFTLYSALDSLDCIQTLAKNNIATNLTSQEINKVANNKSFFSKVIAHLFGK